MADVQRFTRIREDKTALQALLQKGSIGDDLWNSFLTAEKEMQAELLEVMHEANTFVTGWGQLIFTSAGEMVANEKMKAVFDNIGKVKVAQGESLLRKRIQILTVRCRSEVFEAAEERRCPRKRAFSSPISSSPIFNSPNGHNY